MTVKLGVDVLIEPIVPEVDANDTDVVPVAVPEPLIAPDPLADIVSVVPDTLLFKVMLPLLAVVVNDNAPADASADPVEILLLLLTDKAEKVSPPEERLNA